MRCLPFVLVLCICSAAFAQFYPPEQSWVESVDIPGDGEYTPSAIISLGDAASSDLVVSGYQLPFVPYDIHPRSAVLLRLDHNGDTLFTSNSGEAYYSPFVLPFLNGSVVSGYTQTSQFTRYIDNTGAIIWSQDVQHENMHTVLDFCKTATEQYCISLLEDTEGESNHAVQVVDANGDSVCFYELNDNAGAVAYRTGSNLLLTTDNDLNGQLKLTCYDFLFDIVLWDVYFSDLTMCSDIVRVANDRFVLLADELVGINHYGDVLWTRDIVAHRGRLRSDGSVVVLNDDTGEATLIDENGNIIWSFIPVEDLGSCNSFDVDINDGNLVVMSQELFYSNTEIRSFSNSMALEHHYTCVEETGQHYDIIIDTVYFAEDVDPEKIHYYYNEIGIFDGDLCVGNSFLGNSYDGIRAWEGDPGFQPGNTIDYRFYQRWENNCELVVDSVIYNLGNGTFGYGDHAEVSLYVSPAPALVEFELQTPAYDQLLYDNTVTFRWDSARNPDFPEEVTYDFYLSTRADSLGEPFASTSETFYTTTLLPDIYYWTVVAKDESDLEIAAPDTNRVYVQILTNTHIHGSLGPGALYVPTHISFTETDSMILNPGTYLLFHDGVQFDASAGYLQSMGTVSDSIYFTTVDNATFRGDMTLGEHFRAAYTVLERCNTQTQLTCSTEDTVLQHCDIRNSITNGGIIISGNPIITDCVFRNNQCSLRSETGAGLTITNGRPRIYNTVIRDNERTTYFYGGGATVGENAFPEFYNAHFCNNRVSYPSSGNGGGLAVTTGGSALLVDCLLDSNHSNNYGGGIYMGGDSLIIRNCQLTNNSGSIGGGIAIRNGAVIIDSTDMVHNDVYTNGGGVYASATSSAYRYSLSMQNSTISHNSSGTSGGGLALYSSSNPLSEATIENCHIDENTGEYGACMRVSGEVVINMNYCTFDYNFIDGNSYTDPVFFINEVESITFSHCNILNHEINYLFSGAMNDDATVNMNNSCIVNNNNLVYDDRVEFEVTHCLFYDNVESYPDGIGGLTQVNANGDSCDVNYNLFLNPQFVYPDTGNYQLQASSPCVDAGDPESPNDPDGSIADIGVYPLDTDIPTPPSSFVLISPADDDTIRVNETTLVWQQAYDRNPEDSELHYDVLVSHNADLSDGWYVAEGITDTTFSLPLDDDQTYYWTVHAVDSNTDGTWASSVFSFNTFILDAPGVFTQLLPTDGQTVHNDTVKVVWSTSVEVDPGDYVTYALEWSTYESFTEYYSGFTGDTCCTLTNLADILAGTREAPLGEDSQSPGFVGNSISFHSSDASRQSNDAGLRARQITLSGSRGQRGNVSGANELDELPDDQTIYWRVRAFDQHNLSTWANAGEDGWSFHVDEYQRPEGLSLLEPADEAVINGLSATLCWEAATDPDPYDTPHYDVWLGTEESFEEATLIGDSIEAISIEVDELTDDQTYYWKVRATDSNTEGIWSDVYSFSTYMVSPPAPFQMVAPVDGSVENAYSVTLTWEATTDPDPDDEFSYEVEWSLDAGFENSMSATTTETSWLIEDVPQLLAGGLGNNGTSLQTDAPAGFGGATRNSTLDELDDLPDDNIIYWRVKAVDNHDSLCWANDDAAGWSFSVDVMQAPLAFELSEPADGTVINGLSATLSWETTTDPDPYDTPHYDVWLSTEESFEEATLIGDSITAISIEVPELADDQTYYWKVRATDSNTSGTWSEVYSFSTYEMEPPAPFALLTPANGGMEHGYSATLTWEATTDPDPDDEFHYEVEWSLDDDFEASMSATTTETSWLIEDVPQLLAGGLRNNGTSPQTHAPAGFGGETMNSTLDELDDLPDDNVIYWRVKAVDNHDSLRWANDDATGWSFTVDVYQAPEAFSLLSPVSEDTFWNLEATLTWEETTDPDPYDTPTYTVYMGTSEELTDDDIIAEDLETTSFIQTNLDDDTEYFWTIHANDSNTDGTDASQVWSFRSYLVEPPDAFDLGEPENEAVLAEDIVTITWYPASDPDPGDAVVYEVEWSADADFEVSYATSVTDTFYTITDLDDPELLFSGCRNDGNRRDSHSPEGVIQFMGSTGTETPAIENDTAELDELPDESRIYWRVRAVDRYGTATFANQTDWYFDIYIPEPPELFDLLLPADGDTVEADSCELVWDAATDPDEGDVVSYWIWWATDETFTENLDSTTSGTETSVVIRDLSDDSTYWWKVRAQDTNTIGTWSSQTFHFDVYIAGEPLPFTLITPDSSDTCWTLNQTLLWHATIDPDPDDQVWYDIYVGQSPDFTGADPVNAGLDDTTLTLSNLTDDTRYYWTVKATDNNTDGTWADTVFWFRTYHVDPPDSFDLISPEDELVFDTYLDTLVFRWEEATDPDPNDEIVRYILELGSEADFEAPDSTYDAQTADSIAVVFPSFETEVQYWWRVRAMDSFDSSRISTETRMISVWNDVVEQPFSGIPVEYSIAAAYPNPFNPQLSIVIGLPETAELRVTVFNILGKRVADITHETHQQGFQRFTFDATNLASGMYFIHATVPGKMSEIRKVFLVR